MRTFVIVIIISLIIITTYVGMPKVRVGYL